MKNSILLIFIIGCFFFSVPAAFSTGVTSGKGLKAYSPEGELVGTIEKKKGRFVFYDKDEIHLKKKSKNEWKMFNRDNTFVGILKKEKKVYKFYDNQEEFLGVILLESKILMPRGFNEKKWRLDKSKVPGKGTQYTKVRTPTRAKITPETAWLYLYVLKAIETIE